MPSSQPLRIHGPMGTVDQRLARLYGAVQPSAALPVIVTTKGQPFA